ncbi:hypothetical protein BC629DRAFT_1442020 [Irpex lacteus]|nr:hypothetical protein BC629DRAFT_1442020 [Irpex lacteus]
MIDRGRYDLWDTAEGEASKPDSKVTYVFVLQAIPPTLAASRPLTHTSYYPKNSIPGFGTHEANSNTQLGYAAPTLFSQPRQAEGHVARNVQDVHATSTLASGLKSRERSGANRNVPPPVQSGNSPRSHADIMSVAGGEWSAHLRCGATGSIVVVSGTRPYPTAHPNQTTIPMQTLHLPSGMRFSEAGGDREDIPREKPLAAMPSIELYESTYPAIWSSRVLKSDLSFFVAAATVYNPPSQWLRFLFSTTKAQARNARHAQDYNHRMVEGRRNIRRGWGLAAMRSCNVTRLRAVWVAEFLRAYTGITRSPFRASEACRASASIMGDLLLTNGDSCYVSAAAGVVGIIG